MKHFSKKVTFAFIVGLLLALAVPMTVGAAQPEQSGCVIPDSGPWPPCATGGQATDSWNQANNGGSSTSSDGCVIPPSGPWPPCATGGNSAPAPAPMPESNDAPASEESTMDEPAMEEPAMDEPAAEESSSDGPEIVDEAILYSVEQVAGQPYIIGIFPVIEFDADFLILSSLILWDQIDLAQSNLDRAVAGDKQGCSDFVDLYELVYATTVLHQNVPADWAGLYRAYINAAAQYFVTAEPAYLSCFDSGGISQLNYGQARQGMDVAKNYLQPIFRQLED